jgi:hypothetical protein
MQCMEAFRRCVEHAALFGGVLDTCGKTMLCLAHAASPHSLHGRFEVVSCCTARVGKLLVRMHGCEQRLQECVCFSTQTCKS